MRSVLAPNLCVMLIACALGARAPAAGLSDVYGRVTLVRRGPDAGTESGEALYGDRRYSHAERVDYSRPGFAVVFIDAPVKTPPQLDVELRETRFGVRIEPAEAAVALGAELRVANATSSAQLVSFPRAGQLFEIEPGGSVVLTPDASGAERLVLLGEPPVRATVFVAPGQHVVVSDSGRFELRDLAPGPHQVSVWHPRFPGETLRVDLAPDARTELDLRLGVDMLEGGTP